MMWIFQQKAKLILWMLSLFCDHHFGAECCDLNGNHWRECIVCGKKVSK